MITGARSGLCSSRASRDPLRRAIRELARPPEPKELPDREALHLVDTADHIDDGATPTLYRDWLKPWGGAQSMLSDLTPGPPHSRPIRLTSGVAAARGDGVSAHHKVTGAAAQGSAQGVRDRARPSNANGR